MRQFLFTLMMFAVAVPMPAFTEPASQAEPASLAEAVTAGKGSLAFRYRLETVDQDGLAEDAVASTVRTRVGYRTAPYRGFTLQVEIDDLSYLGGDRFNNTRNGKAMYPVVADPKGTDVNQLFIEFAGRNVAARIGRQRINLDNQRFVGGVGWRQNEQTYDALHLAHEGDSVHASYTWVSRVARIFGPDNGAPAPLLDSNSHLLNLAIEGSGFGRLSGYVYSLDFDNAAAASTLTIGARYSNTFNGESVKVPVALEYARQQDSADNPASLSVGYLLAEVGAEFETVGVRLGNEILEGSATGAFSTPLATLHKFQGWADKFLATPAAGIDDLYVSVSGKLAGNTLAATWHRFEAESGATDYGSEIDLSLARKLNDNFSVLFKLARYDADQFATDTTKAWLMVTASF